jgi:hypothetical protein
MADLTPPAEMADLPAPACYTDAPAMMMLCCTICNRVATRMAEND